MKRRCDGCGGALARTKTPAKVARIKVKVQRGWKSMKTPLAEGQRIHYNFVKPHAALEGQTPAERAGVGVEGENKWLTLIQKAMKE